MMSCSQPIAAVFKALADLHEFLGGKEAVGGVLGGVVLGAGAGEAELVAGEAGGVGLDFGGPLAAGGLVEHVAGGGVVVDADLVAEAAAEEGGGGNAEDLAGEVPECHFDAAGGTHEVVGRAVGAGAAERGAAGAEACVDGVDLQRVLADKPGLEGEDLLLDPDAGAAVGFADAVDTVIGGDFDEGIGAPSLHHHDLDVADFDLADLCGGGGKAGEKKAAG
jgi:hypothetical protein